MTNRIPPPRSKLKFKYYQRVEGTFRIPQGQLNVRLQAQVLEAGQDYAQERPAA